MSDGEPAASFPGLLYAGDGTPLAGGGPSASGLEASADLPFKALICQQASGDGDLGASDRVWVLPRQFDKPEGLPVLLILHLAGLVRSGRKVQLASADELVCAQVRDMLLLALADAKGDVTMPTFGRPAVFKPSRGH